MWISRKENEQRKREMASMREDIDNAISEISQLHAWRNSVFDVKREAVIAPSTLRYVWGFGMTGKPEHSAIEKTYILKSECMPVEPARVTPKKRATKKAKKTKK